MAMPGRIRSRDLVFWSGILNQFIQCSFAFLSVVILLRPMSVTLPHYGIRRRLISFGGRRLLILVHRTDGSGRRASDNCRIFRPGISRTGLLRHRTAYQYAGTEGRTRTDTGLPQPDFESSASTNFATPAWLGRYSVLSSDANFFQHR